ncbi:hypothetical protein AC1031_014381 [Aphanomyces cochlioides]|nr:hypothetical protein AC1031_014381 [Aphanomyces cochlioides]
MFSKRQGIQWLSERVFHQACQVVLRNHAYQGHIDETLSLDVHLSEDIDDDGITISALETRYIHTMRGHFETIARDRWNNFLAMPSTISRQEDRVVATHCYVAKDELFPLGDGVLRPHGFSWTMYEATSPDMTLVHTLTVKYTPITRNGRVIPLERIGQLFGRPSFGIQHHDAYIELIRSAAERAFIDSHNAMVRELSAEKD